jgi:hypothetical protein
MKRRLLLFAAFLLCFSGLAEAQCFLRQSTAGQEVSLGPFLDSTDGDSAETGLTISNTDIRVKKGSANWAAKNSGGATHEENGNYFATFDATDTSTVGILEIFVHESGALAVWKTCFVLEANEYDSLIGSDVKQVDLLQWGGATPNAMISGRPDVNIGAAQNNVFTAASAAADLIIELQTGLYFGPRKNVAHNNYLFKLRNADGTAYTTGTNANITCARSIDGGALSNCAASATTSILHISQGTYKLNFAASDLNGDAVWIRISGPNCASTANNCFEQYVYPLH